MFFAAGILGSMPALSLHAIPKHHNSRVASAATFCGKMSYLQMPNIKRHIDGEPAFIRNIADRR